MTTRLSAPRPWRIVIAVLVAAVLVAAVLSPGPVRAQATATAPDAGSDAATTAQDPGQALDQLTQLLNETEGDTSRYQFLVRADDPCRAMCGYFLGGRWYYHGFAFGQIDPGSFSPRKPTRRLQQLRFAAAPGEEFLMEVYDEREILIFEGERADAQCVVPVAAREIVQASMDQLIRACQGG